MRSRLDMARNRLPIVAGIVALLAGIAHGQTGGTTALRSPWDVHPVKLSGAHYACPAPIHVPHDITLSDYYSDAKHSVIDPVRHATYAEAEKPFQALMTAAEAAADDFQQTGSREAADCVMKQLRMSAQDDAMTGAMSSNQAYYVQGWTLGAIAITELKVRTANPGSEADRAAVAAWLERIAASTHSYFQAAAEKKPTAQNNHLYWAGMAVLAAGVVANNRAEYDWGVGTYRKGIDSIAADGTLPAEMGRGQRALHYHLFAIEPLVELAEFGEANGDDLYAYRANAIARLIARSVGGMLDPRFFVAATGVEQEGNYRQPAAGSISWAVPYSRRFPAAVLTSLLAQARGLSDLYLGGLPPR